MSLIMLIMSMVIMMIMLVIGLSIFGSVSDNVICPVDDGTGNNFSEECQQAKDSGWVVLSILPIAVLIMIFPIVRMLGMPDFSSFKTKSGSKNSKNLPLFTKILLYLGIVRIRERR